MSKNAFEKYRIYIMSVYIEYHKSKNETCGISPKAGHIAGVGK